MRTKPRGYIPSIHWLEERINLSFSLSNFVHTLVPFIPDHSTKAKHGAIVKAQSLTNAEVATHPRLAASIAARASGESRALNPMARTPGVPKGAFNWYGPKLGSPTVKAR